MIFITIFITTIITILSIITIIVTVLSIITVILTACTRLSVACARARVTPHPPALSISRSQPAASCGCCLCWHGIK